MAKDQGHETPAKLSEPAGEQLGHFGITTIPGARVNMAEAEPPGKGDYSQIDRPGPAKE